MGGGGGGGRLPKKDGGLGQFADLREGERWGKEGGGGGWGVWKERRGD